MKRKISAWGAVLLGAALMGAITGCTSVTAGAATPPAPATPVTATPAPTAAAPGQPAPPRRDDSGALASVPRGDPDTFARASARPPRAANGSPRPAPKMSAPRPAPPPPPGSNIIASGDYFQVRVFYGTDRAPTGPGKFGPRRNETAEPISYGSLFVSVPRDHQAGEVNPPSWWQRADPAEHMIILNRIPKSQAQFLADIRDSLARSGSQSSFVFVHGYNVSFDDAALRTAQITFDLKYGGAPVFYSWPSEGAVRDYAADYDNSDWARTNLKNFLLAYARDSGARDIYLIAHSMGNRALTFALTDLFGEHPEMRGRFKEIILAAPDIDAGIFKRDIAPKLTAGGDRITLYVSGEDKALHASKTARSDYVRLGDTSGGIAVIPGIETVDATGLDTSFLAHSYFAENSIVRDDIRKLLQQGLRAAERGLREVIVNPGETYWKFIAR